MGCFERYLLTERGLGEGTVCGYVSHARRFVGGLESDQGLAGLTAAEVTAAVLERSAAVSVSTTQNFVAGLRSFLRLCFVEGLVDRDLSQAALPSPGGAAAGCLGGSPRRTPTRCWVRAIVAPRWGAATTR